MDLEKLSARLEGMRGRLADARATLAGATFSGQSDDKRITATVNSAAHLVGLKIDPRIFRLPDSEGLAEAILLATQRARDGASTTANDLLQSVLGPAVNVDKLNSGEDIEDMIKSAGRHLSTNEGPNER
ncbi:YbaB/EbfC family nucleoid-associated protein [Actinopolymorpha alba]|uniref:YbaB/EbfC family nucleoid-associated protein n=1 Tax=Actinopolymorpha alba TaxID=533267 RepID=UPI0003A212BD|nr:YbaB/EbfC family nucleoid-associated protein [Actinopolymorpha alba]